MDSYRVQADDGLGGSFADVAVVTEAYATVASLQPGRPYRFRVAAETPAGPGPYCPPYRQVVATVPGAPDAPRAESVAGRSDRLLVSWAPPADTGGALILGFKAALRGSRSAARAACAAPEHRPLGVRRLPAPPPSDPSMEAAGRHNGRKPPLPPSRNGAV